MVAVLVCDDGPLADRPVRVRSRAAAASADGPVPSLRPANPGRATVRRRRLVVLTSLVLAVAGGWFALQAALGWIGGGPLTATGQPGGLRSVATRVWVVRSGDTLWGIAAASGASGDLRPLVDRLSDEVGHRPLQPGERVTLPGP